MAAIKHTELFDFPAYEAGIKDVKAATVDFGKTAEEALKRITAQQKELTGSLKQYADILKAFNVTTNGAAAGLANYNKQIDENIKEMTSLKAVSQGLASVVDLNRASVQELEAEYKGLKAQLKALKPEQEGYQAQVAAINSRIKQVIPAIGAFNTTLKNTTQVVKNAEGSYKAMQAQLTALRNRLKEMPGAFDPYTGALNKSNKEAVALQAKISVLDNTLKKADSQMGIYGRNVGNYSSAVKGLASNLGALFGIASAFDIGKKIFDVNREFDGLNTAIKLVSGTQEEFAKNQLFLTAVAEKYGLEIVGLTKGFKNFYASATQAGLTTNQTRIIFDQASNAAANLKLSQEDINGVLLAFGQVAAKGKVQAEELRGQIGERIPGAYAIAARAIGKTGAELNKLLELGELNSIEFLPKFGRELEKAFGQEQKVATLNSEINRLFNTLETGVQSEGFTFFMSKFIKQVNEGVKGIFLFTDSIYELFEGYNKVQGRKIAEQQASATAAVVADFRTKDREAQKKEYAYQQTRDKEAQENLAKTIDKYGKSMKDIRVRNAQQAADAERKTLEELAFTYKDIYYPPTAAKRPKSKEEIEKEARAAQEAADKAEAARKRARKAEIDAVRDQEALLKRASELDIANQELLLSEKAINEEEYQRRRLEIIKEYVKQAVALEKSLGKDSDKAKIEDLLKGAVEAQTAFNNFQIKAREERKKAEAKELDESLSARKKYFDQLGKDRKEAQDDAMKAELAGENVAFAAISNNRDTTYVEEVKHFERLKAIKLKYLADTTQEEIALNELNADRRRQLAEQTQEFEFDVAFAAADILKQNSDARFEERIMQLEKQRDVELSAAGNNAAAKEAIEKRFNAQVAKEKRKQAQADKNFALFNVAINTAQAVAKTFSIWGWPIGIPFAALAVGQGALQAAIIASKPIPQFKKGTKSAPAGLAIVGEEGSELIERNGKMYVTPNKASFVKLTGGEKIHTHKETVRILEQAENSAAIKRMLEGDKNSAKTASEIRNEKDMQAIKIMASSARINQQAIEQAFDKAVSNIPLQTTVFDERGMRKVQQERNSRITYLNNRTLGNN